MKTLFISGGYIPLLWILVLAWMEWWPWSIVQMAGPFNWGGWIYPKDWNDDEM